MNKDNISKMGNITESTIGTLFLLAKGKSVPVAVRLKAIEIIMDRAGIKLPENKTSVK